MNNSHLDQKKNNKFWRCDVQVYARLKKNGPNDPYHRAHNFFTKIEYCR